MKNCLTAAAANSDFDGFFGNMQFTARFDNHVDSRCFTHFYAGTEKTGGTG